MSVDIEPLRDVRAPVLPRVPELPAPPRTPRLEARWSVVLDDGGRERLACAWVQPDGVALP